MKKRILTLIIAISLLWTPYTDIAAQETNNSGGLATATDADEAAASLEAIEEHTTQADNESDTIITNNYIDTGDRIDYYEAASAPYMLYGSILPNKYDSRDKNVVTSVKNQNPYGTCWAFAALASGESSLISQGKATADIDLSEYHLAYFFYNSSTDPLGNLDGDRNYINPLYSNRYNYLTIGGNNYYTMFALSSWRGAANESIAPYENAAPNSTLDAGLAYNDAAHLQDVRIVSVSNADEVKSLIMMYGSVASSMYMDNMYYNYSTYGYYENVSESCNHAITIIGWDDDYSVDNFNTSVQPESSGAWLVKNSWGTSAQYLWISYEDYALKGQDAFAYIMDTSDNYDNNYQYDGTNVVAESIIDNGNSIANVYTINAADKEEIDAVSIALKSDNVKYSIQLYKNPEPDKPMSGETLLSTPIVGTTTYAGYYTIDIPNPVTVSKGDNIAVVFTLWDTDDDTVSCYRDMSSTDNNSESLILFESHTEEGQSYVIYSYNSTAVDMGIGSGSGCARIKMFTNNIDEETVTPDTPDDSDDDKGDTPSLEPVQLSLCTVSTIAEQYYTGSKITPSVSLTYNGTVLTMGKDYTISYTNNINPGNSTVTINGIGNYIGSKTISFTIYGKRNPTTKYNGIDYSAVYDYNYYVMRYPDIWSAYKTDDVAVLRHFVIFGMGEGRQAKATFNVDSYACRYSDLRQTYKNNLTGYYLHYINYGKKEGRTATGNSSILGGQTVYDGIDYASVYNYGYYISRYADIKTSFGYDEEAALVHFIKFGMKEKRQGIESFNVDSYACRYSDLRRVYKNNMAGYYIHYINYGKKEGRIATGDISTTGGNTVYNGVDYSAVYSYSFYVSHYSDIRAAFGYDEEAALVHFINFGMREGRQGINSFNVSVYKNRYADLQQAYGGNLQEYYMHYIKFGVSEHRSGK